MKTLKTLAILFIATLATGLVSSCSDDDDDPVVSYEWIAGTWKIEDRYAVYVDGADTPRNYSDTWNILFNADGTGSDGDFIKWSLKGDTFDFGCYEDGEWYDRYTGKFTKVSEDQFKVHYEYSEKDEDSYGSGETHTYRYVGDLTFTRIN